MTRFRATVTFEYEVAAVEDAYNTLDPFAMAEIDRVAAEDDLGLFISLASESGEYDVQVQPFPEGSYRQQRCRTLTADGLVEGHCEMTIYGGFEAPERQIRLDDGRLITTTEPVQFYAADV